MKVMSQDVRRADADAVEDKFEVGVRSRHRCHAPLPRPLPTMIDFTNKDQRPPDSLSGASARIPLLVPVWSTSSPAARRHDPITPDPSHLLFIFTPCNTSLYYG
jgi:hypothetical protein